MNIEYFLAGTISGIFQTIIGHPLDTLKILKQNNKLKKYSYKFRNLYCGFSMPIIQTPIICGVGFYIDSTLVSYTNNHFISGIISGAIGSLFISPFEYYKINLQQKSNVKIDFKTFINSYKHLYLVLLREVPATSIYFGSYYKLKEYNIPIFLSGGISGVLSWFLTYPIDTIKSRIQGNISKTIKCAIKKGSLTNGLTYCLIRGFIVNSVAFESFEYSLNIIDYKNHIEH